MWCNLGRIDLLLMMEIIHWTFTMNKHYVAACGNDDPIIQDQYVSNGFVIWKKKQFVGLFFFGKDLLLAYKVII